MMLTLTLSNVDRLDNGEPTQLKLDRHGAIIGRSPHSDWSLPDPKNYVSSTHCEIDYRDGAYLLIDKSTNGTFVNGSEQRMAGPHVLRNGDVLTIGHYKVGVSGGSAGDAAGPGVPAPAPPPVSSGGSGDWGGWSANPAAPGAAAPAASAGWEGAASGWSRPSPATVNSGWGDGVAPEEKPDAGWATPAVAAGGQAPASAGWGAADERAASDWRAVDDGALGGRAAAQGWGAPSVAQAPASAGSASPNWGAPPPAIPDTAQSAWRPTAAPAGSAYGAQEDGSVWGAAGAGPAEPKASGWDSIAPARGEAAAQDGWGASSAAITGRGAMAQNWSPPRVGAPAPPPVAAASLDVWGAMAASNAVDWSRGGFGDPASTPAAGAEPGVSPAPPLRPTLGDAAWSALLDAAGVPSESVKVTPGEAAATAGALLKRLVAGLVVMMEARARAKAQLGAQSTTLELKGNNPIKFARSPERVLAQLLNPPERGFMGATDAVEDSFRDLQAHQMATLAAMQGALRATLDRFSPEAIRKRAEMRGVLARILPGARNATLWEAYEREFEGVAKGSDEAFMDVFAKAFKAAYEQVSAEMKAKGG